MARVSFSSMIGGLILLATAYLFYHTFDTAYQTSLLTAGRGPVFYPRIVLAAMTLFSVIVIAEGVGEKNERPDLRTMLVVLAAIGLTGAYILSINPFGFVIPTAIFTFLLPFVLGYRNWLIALAVAVLYTAAVWYIFNEIFLIILPSSPWFEVF